MLMIRGLIFGGGLYSGFFCIWDFRVFQNSRSALPSDKVSSPKMSRYSVCSFRLKIRFFFPSLENKMFQNQACCLTILFSVTEHKNW